MAADAERRARVQQLLQEFDTSIAPQKLALVSVLPDIWSATYGQTPAMPPLAAAPAAGLGSRPGAGIKREGEPLAVQPDVKRPRSAEVQRKIDGLFKLCQAIVAKKLWAAKNATWFKEPVNPAIAPNYYHYIKRPMDLGTIKKRLQDNYYKTPYEFKDDVDLVWSNCAAYNQEGTPVRKAGDQVRAIWERAWREANIEQQWQQIQFELDPSGAPLSERLHALSQQLLQTVDSVPGPSQAEDRSRPMTFAQKRRLSARLGSVTPDLAHRVLEIVAEDPAAATGASGVEGTEVELEVDQLQPDTLWRLRDLLDGRAGGAARPAMVAAAGVAPMPQQGRPMMAGKTPGPGGAGASAASKGAGMMDTNGGAMSVQSSGVASESGSGEGGGHNSQDNKGSTLEGPRQGGFVRDNRQMVDESATAPKEQSQFVKDRAAARKGDVAINSANWDLLPSEVGPSDAPQPEGDDVWKSFQSIAEQKQQREEQQRREAEAAEAKKREERERARREEEERQQRLRAEEERQAAELQRQRDEQMHKELEEMRAQAGTANLTQHSELASLAGMPGLGAPVGHGGGLAALGLESRDDDDDMNFDD